MIRRVRRKYYDRWKEEDDTILGSNHRQVHKETFMGRYGQFSRALDILKKADLQNDYTEWHGTKT